MKTIHLILTGIVIFIGITVAIISVYLYALLVECYVFDIIDKMLL